MHKSVCLNVYEYYMHSEPAEARKGQKIPWNWRYRQFCTAVRVLGIKSASSEIAASMLYHFQNHNSMCFKILLTLTSSYNEILILIVLKLVRRSGLRLLKCHKDFYLKYIYLNIYVCAYMNVGMYVYSS